MDWALGSLVDGLKQRGLYDNTLLIITADHGEGFGGKAIMGHAASIYQNEIHVPLLIKYPRQRSSAVMNAPVSLADLMPTVLEGLGYAVPEGVQGCNLAKIDSNVFREVISETYPHPVLSTWHPRFRDTRQAIFSGPLKLIRSSRGHTELYNLAEDPREERNLWPTAEGAVLEAKLLRYLTTVTKNRNQSPARPSSESLEMLKGLGYIE